MTDTFLPALKALHISHTRSCFLSFTHIHITMDALECNLWFLPDTLQTRAASSLPISRLALPLELQPAWKCTCVCERTHLHAVLILHKSKAALTTNTSTMSQQCFGPRKQPPCIVSYSHEITHLYRPPGYDSTQVLKYMKFSAIRPLHPFKRYNKLSRLQTVTTRER